MNAMTLLQRICSAYCEILGQRLTGFYVHGSVAFGCFTWATGDLDFIAVVNAPLTPAQKEALIRLLLRCTPDAPPKGFEMSVVLAQHCRPFVYPTPFELHFSAAHQARAEADLTAFCRDMHGDDPDLAAHFTVLQSVGITLYGPPIAQVFGEVPHACYLDSILRDVSDASEAIVANPVYATLNLCRVLAYLQEGCILSKEQGGRWGLAHLPEKYHPLLRMLLSSYRTGTPIPQTAALPSIADDLLGRIARMAPEQDRKI